MAYGLVINDESGNEWFNSETTFGFIEIVNQVVNGTTTVNLSGTLPGYTTVYPVYTPADVVDNAASTGSFRPNFTVSHPSTGTGAWSVTMNFVGSGTSLITGGRLLIFAH